jgi:hypothetical protein
MKILNITGIGKQQLEWKIVGSRAHERDILPRYNLFFSDWRISLFLGHQ